MKFGISCLSFLLLAFSLSAAYSPSHYDTRMLEYATQDVIENNRNNRSVQERTDIRTKIKNSSKSSLSEQLLWYVKGILSYRDDKSGITEDSAPDSLAIQYVKVIEDGKGDLNMRSGPSKNFDVVGKLSEGEIVKVTLEMNGWFEIDKVVDEKRAWVMGEYVVPSEKSNSQSVKQSISDREEETRDEIQETITPTVTEAQVQVVISAKEAVIKTVEVSPNDAGTLRVRNGASGESKILGKLDVGDQVDVYEEKDGYFRIDWNAGDEFAWIAVHYVHLAGTEAPIHHLTVIKPIDNASVTKSKKAFLDTYRHLVDSKDKELIDLCKTYYDEIDAIAREYDFPVELIIATRFREHTCKFKNPSNGRGNFQIITRYYQPGPITRSQFEQQVIDFIKFSEGKRVFYDQTQNFGPLPIELSYDTFDLLSIRKHAIYYNGIVSTPEKNVYANQNFNGISVGGADGIVAAFLKVLKYGLEK